MNINGTTYWLRPESPSSGDNTGGWAGIKITHKLVPSKTNDLSIPHASYRSLAIKPRRYTRIVRIDGFE